MQTPWVCKVHINLTAAILTLQMLRLLSSKAQEPKIIENHLNPAIFGIHLKALTEFSQKSTHVPSKPGHVGIH